jgi:hypothetical protein
MGPCDPGSRTSGSAQSRSPGPRERAHYKEKPAPVNAGPPAELPKLQPFPSRRAWFRDTPGIAPADHSRARRPSASPSPGVRRSIATTPGRPGAVGSVHRSRDRDLVRGNRDRKSAFRHNPTLAATRLAAIFHPVPSGSRTGAVGFSAPPAPRPASAGPPEEPDVRATPVDSPLFPASRDSSSVDTTPTAESPRTTSVRGLSHVPTTVFGASLRGAARPVRPAGGGSAAQYTMVLMVMSSQISLTVCTISRLRSV